MHLWNKILATSQYPEAWKKETTIVIPKKTPPSSKDDLRNIGLTPFFSKAFEKILVEWLWDCVKSKWDGGQFGSRPGSSCTHYIIYLVDFILRNWEKGQTSVLLLLLDWSKGFNRILHSRLITILSDLGVPPFLLRIIFSFLSNRKMIVRHCGALSDEQNLNGGGPQGSLLIVILFCLYTNAQWSMIRGSGQHCQFKFLGLYYKIISQKNKFYHFFEKVATFDPFLDHHF